MRRDMGPAPTLNEVVDALSCWLYLPESNRTSSPSIGHNITTLHDNPLSEHTFDSPE